MFCPECGTKNEDDARFCEACGTSLVEFQVQQEPAPQPPYQQAPQGQPYQQEPVPQPPYQQEPQQQYQPPRPPKKPVPKALIAVIFECLLAAGLIVGIVLTLNNKFSPESVALKYWEAVMAHEWGQAYDYCEFPDNDLLTKQMYVNVSTAGNSKTPLQYKSVRVEKENNWAAGDYDTNDRSAGIYVIRYMVKGSAGEETDYLTLVKTGKKKFLFWDEWKVTDSDSWSQDVHFEIPVGATLKLNGVEVTDADVTEDAYGQYLTIPYLFTGSYQMEVEGPGMEPYRGNTYVDYYGCEDSHVSLRPSTETVKSVMAQAEADFATIMDSALAGADFSTIESLFSEDMIANEGALYEYEDLLKITGDGVDEGVVTLMLGPLTIYLDGEFDGDTIYLIGEAQLSETYLQYWTDELGEYDGDVEFYFTYVKEGDTWKLDNMPVYDYYF